MLLLCCQIWNLSCCVFSAFGTGSFLVICYLYVIRSKISITLCLIEESLISTMAMSLNSHYVRLHERSLNFKYFTCKSISTIRRDNMFWMKNSNNYVSLGQYNGFRLTFVAYDALAGIRHCIVTPVCWLVRLNDWFKWLAVNGLPAFYNPSVYGSIWNRRFCKFREPSSNPYHRFYEIKIKTENRNRRFPFKIKIQTTLLQTIFNSCSLNVLHNNQWIWFLDNQMFHHKLSPSIYG